MVNIHSEPIYKILSVNDHVILNICSNYKFSENIKQCNWKRFMWQYFESTVER